MKGIVAPVKAAVKGDDKKGLTAANEVAIVAQGTGTGKKKNKGRKARGLAPLKETVKVISLYATPHLMAQIMCNACGKGMSEHDWSAVPAFLFFPC